MQRAALYTAGAIFAIGALAHGVRLATGFSIVVNDFVMPYWVSFPGVLATAGLAVWMLLAARQG